MRYQSKHPNIPPALADNLINSLSGLTAIEGDAVRRQVIMLLIAHSYALGYMARADAGLVARTRSRLALARRRAARDIKLALTAIRERLAMIFRDHGRCSHQMLVPTFDVWYLMRGAVITNAVPVRRFHCPAALLIQATDCHRRNQMDQPSAAPYQGARRWLKEANLN